MLERELREFNQVPRWSIVRTLRQQFLAEHIFFVTMYANDIGVFIGLEDSDQLALLQMCLWHEADELFTGDITGPAKRGLATDRKAWDAKLAQWTERLFGDISARDGSNTAKRSALVIAIVKLADYLDECCEMGSELQLGNVGVKLIFRDSLERVKNAVRAVVSAAGTYSAMEMGELHETEVPLDGPSAADKLMELCVDACHASHFELSKHTSVFDTL